MDIIVGLVMLISLVVWVFFGIWFSMTLNAIERNTRETKEQLQNHTRMLSVIANSYNRQQL